ncbi:AAA family ATPase [uncultured Paraglaciecola sp.]|uniref:ATP-dependent DNA helicase n=1 Tax=uncultured Paraglaciecola sp. TaxID=1765024 RepID=UPI0026049BAD|nr:AAA family ATPase [uncultured Paraglaciecola sp.]
MSLQYENSESLNNLYSNRPVSPINTPRSVSKRGLLKPSGTKKDPGQVINSPDQDNAKQEIIEFLLSNETCISLVGPAGSGKTTILKQILTDAKKRKWRVALSAPTHQAAARIREATNFHADTTHRLLGVSLVRDEKTGKQYLKAKGAPDIQPGTVMVIDEASMLPDQLLTIVLKFVEKNDCKVIFVGDAAQLNPVKEKPSKTVDKDTCEWELIELTTIHRQAAENPIIALATAIRLADPRQLPEFKTHMNGKTGIQHMTDKREWADFMVQQCGMDDFQHRYIAYTNRATDEAAKAVRKHRYGAEAASNPYLKGEVLVVNSRCIPPDSAGKSRSKKKRQEQTVIQANEQVVVKNVWRDNDFYHVECDWNGHHVVLKAFESYIRREAYLEQLKRWAIQNSNWGEFFDASDSIADLRSAVSVTAHSSQGSTYDNVFINLTVMKLCRNPEELQRLLYVAVTRASGCVYSTGSLK